MVVFLLLTPVSLTWRSCNTSILWVQGWGSCSIPVPCIGSTGFSLLSAMCFVSREIMVLLHKPIYMLITRSGMWSSTGSDHNLRPPICLVLYCCPWANYVVVFLPCPTPGLPFICFFPYGNICGSLSWLIMRPAYLGGCEVFPFPPPPHSTGLILSCCQWYQSRAGIIPFSGCELCGGTEGMGKISLYN